MEKTIENSAIIKRLLLITSLLFAIGGLFAGNLSEMLPGLIKIITSPSQLTMDYFWLGGVGASFMNAAIVGFLCWLLLSVSKGTANSGTVMAYFLTVGFSFFGMNFVNILPCFLGTFLYSVAKRDSFGKYINFAMFSTAVAPFVSEMMFRYPEAETRALTVLGLVLGILLGTVAGFIMPALAAHSPNAHKGYSLYSAALPAGLIAFTYLAIFFKTRGIDTPVNTNIGDGFNLYANIFCCSLFVICAITGFLMNGKSFNGYTAIFKSTGYKTDFISANGLPVSLIHIGLYGLFIMAYYNLVGASFTGATVGAVFCMLSVSASGSHGFNVLPIMIGYAIASLFSAWTLNTQAIVVGLCFATGLAPITGRFGIIPGIISGILHGCCVTLVPALHGGFCLYNGGLTCCLLAIIAVPLLETFLTPSEHCCYRLFAPFVKSREASTQK
ncbi:MAG: DUF1576 domain-containing protein [Oscillospiraceae bacterium]